MRTKRELADGSTATETDYEPVCGISRSRFIGHHETALSLRILSGVAGLMLAACSETKAPTYEVSQATLAQYANTCAGCHAEGAGGAPKTGDSADWKQRVAKGMNKVRENAILGFEGATGIMPAKGGYADLSDEEVNAITDYMVDISR
jgi:cytochrome c5